MKPALTADAIVNFLHHWYDFMGPLIYLTSPENYTALLGMASFNGYYATKWHYLMAASTATILLVVVLFLVAQRYFIYWIVVSGVKG